MTPRVVCCYPTCTKDATKTGVFGADVGDEILGQVPLCDEHYKYVQAEEHKAEVEDLFGPPIRFIPKLTYKVREVWNDEALQRDQ